MRIRALALLATALLLGCSDPASEPAAQSSAEPVGQAAGAQVAREVGNPFPSATEVKLFVNSGYDAEGHPIMSGSRILTPAQRKAFEAALRIEPMPEALDACFIPHHFFRYYDEQGSQIGEIKVCFCCEGVQVSPGASAVPDSNEIFGADYSALKRLVQLMGERTDIEC
jgi:hypothetical protein